MNGFYSFLAVICILLSHSTVAVAHPSFAAPSCRSGSTDDRTRCLLQTLSTNEKLALVLTHDATGWDNAKIPDAALGSAAFLALPASIGLPALQITDAGLGVGNPYGIRPDGAAVSLPSELSTASTWDPDMARKAGTMIGGEAWRQGFNILLAGGLNLTRDPRGGRNFEYAGEDPVLAGYIVSGIVQGIQSQHVISTVKHFAMNALETSRTTMSANINEAALRESDLLAFEIAIEIGKPGSVMCSYNRLNGTYTSENDALITGTLKRDWRYPGFVMSDWGGTHSTVRAVLAGLDQESGGDSFDARMYFGAPLVDAVRDGRVPMSRLDDMAYRILRSLVAVGLIDHPPVKQALDLAADTAVAQSDEEEGAVLLRNRDAILPLSKKARIAVIGGHANVGVISGGGSSQVQPVGGNGVRELRWGPPSTTAVYDPSSPLQAFRAVAPDAEIRYASGDDIRQAAELAAQADVAVVFATQWSREAFDQTTLSLPDAQDSLITAIAKANPNVVVVLETGGPVLMPWLGQVKGVMEAWYPGSGGGPAIARLLYGEISPSGHLPMTFPRDLSQLPRPEIPAVGANTIYQLQFKTEQEVDFSEGAYVGYRWFAFKHQTPLFPFGFGLTYSGLRRDHLTIHVKAATSGPEVEVAFEVTNTGQRATSDVAEIYVTPPNRPEQRLAGFARLKLAAGETQKAVVKLDDRVLANFDQVSDIWQGKAGKYRIRVASDAMDAGLAHDVDLQAWVAPP